MMQSLCHDAKPANPSKDAHGTELIMCPGELCGRTVVSSLKPMHSDAKRPDASWDASAWSLAHHVLHVPERDLWPHSSVQPQARTLCWDASKDVHGSELIMSHHVPWQALWHRVSPKAHAL